MTRLRTQSRIGLVTPVKLVLLIAACFWGVAFLSVPLTTYGAQVKRVVIIKMDGLPNYLVDEYVNERDLATGKSVLPWFDYIFYQRGTRLPNFYVRGMSISAPSWSMLDTGQHLQIKSNVEYDRLTLHSYDYLNFFPYYLNSMIQNRADMPGVEVLDDLKIPLLLDSYDFANRLQGFQLYQRGIRWLTLGRGTANHFIKPPLEMATEWTIGFEMRSLLTNQVEDELIENLKNPDIRYLDYYSGDFDHAAHHDNNRDSLLKVLKSIDALLGRVWTGIQNSSLADDTALIIVSDHGMNNDPKVRSQGYNLVNLLGSASGGGHHVVTKRRLLLDYSIKGIYPLIPLVTTASASSYYLKNESEDYPTALLDFDGNERATIHLRNNDLNILHILLKELARLKLDQLRQQAGTNAFFATLDRCREDWATEISEISEELTALRSIIKDQKARIDSLPTKWSADETRLGLHVAALREKARLLNLMRDESEYAEYIRGMEKLLSLRKDNFDIKHLKVNDLLPHRSMGEINSIHNLQNYVVGIAGGGLVLDANNNLDMERSFKRIDYPALLKSIALRNNVQPGVGNRPIDFVALRVPRESLIHRLAVQELPSVDAILLYGGNDKQVLVLMRNETATADTRVMIKYMPIANFREDAEGNAAFEEIKLQNGLPLEIFEDPALRLPDESRSVWLSKWHDEVEWLRAIHKTKYSNGLIGVVEALARHDTRLQDIPQNEATDSERLLYRFRLRQRIAVEPDLNMFTNDHWNFDVRGFNPGGNHGSFLRVSTNATFMVAGGANTKIPRGVAVEEPYDTLSFVPTIMALTGGIVSGRPTPVAWQRGFRTFPGRIVREVLGGSESAEPLGYSEQQPASPAAMTRTTGRSN